MKKRFLALLLTVMLMAGLVPTVSFAEMTGSGVKTISYYLADNTKPVIDGIENGKTYCGKQSFTVAEENLGQVTINGDDASAVDGKYTIPPAEGEQTIVVTDKAGNRTEMKVTVNDGHTLKYMRLQNIKIIETCEICGTIGHEESAYLKVSDADYAGSPIENAEVEYSTGWLGGNLKITYTNNDRAGTATASISIGGVTLERDFTIRKGSQNAPTGIGKKDENIDGKADGKLTNVNGTMEYRKKGETENTYTPITGDKVEDLEDGTYYVRYAENDNYNASPDSDPVVIAAGRKINVHFMVDGEKIKTKEISWGGSIVAEDLPAIPPKAGYNQTTPHWDKTLKDLEGIKTYEDVFVSAQYTINRYNVPLTPGEGYTLEAVSTNPVNHGGSFTFKVVIAKGYSKTDAFAVQYDGRTIPPNADGSYTVTVLNGLVSPNVLGVAENTAPTGEITIDTNKWHEFLNNITFGLFFKDTQDVTITAEDAGSGVREISYHIAEAEMTLEKVKTLTDWQVYSSNFNIEPNHEYIIYAKITDNAGNVTYINSNGVVLDNILPAISGIENGKTYCKAAEVTVDEAYLDNITVNGEAVTLKDGKFTVVPVTGEQTIVVTDKAGNRTEMTITVNDKHSYGEWTDAEDGKYHIRTCSCGAVGTEAHKWDNGKVTKEATAVEKGEKTYTCEVCSATKTEAIPMLNETSKTGDDSNLMLWLILFFAGGAGLLGMTLHGRRKASKH